jgi:hypothetical protein
VARFRGRDSLPIQRIAVSDQIQFGDGVVNGAVEAVEIDEGSVRKVTRFQIAPNDLDVVQLGGVFGQPFDGEPVGAFGQRRPAGLADVDRTVVEDQDHRLVRRPGSGAVEAVERLQMRDEVHAPLGPRGRDDQLAPGVVERAHHRDLLSLSGRRNPQVGAALGPGARKIGMGQSFALIAEQQHDVASLGLRLEQLQTQPAAIDRLGVLATLQRVAGSPIAKAPFLRSALESCDLEIVTPSRAAISSAKRASVQLTRFVTGADRRGSATRKAACVFTGVGPGKGRVSKASTPLSMNSLRQRRTVSSRTPKASAMRGLVQPRSVKRMALALSASARSDPTAFDSSAAICSCVARTGDLPAMLHPPNHLAGRNHKRRPLARPVKLA